MGSIEISQNEFSQAYQTQFDNLRRRFGGRITAEQARAFGFDQQVLSQLVGGAAIDNHTHDLKLGISDETIIARPVAGSPLRGRRRHVQQGGL